MQKFILALCAIGAGASMAGASHAQDVTSAVDPAAVAAPALAFHPDEEAANSFDKYFFFHREETDFATAYADILECDGYARGFGYHAGGAVPAYYAGTLGGALGGAIGSALADAIHGSAERRRMRRANMSTCMGFKEYKAYGLPKELWVQFNFEEGLNRVDEGRRLRLLQAQAKAASGPKPLHGEIAQ